MASSNSPKRGSLSTEAGYRAGGRKMDTWKFHAAGPTPDTMINLVFEVFLDKNSEGIFFRVETADIPAERWPDTTGTDIQALRQQAEAAAQREMDVRLGLTWSSWLEVRVSETDAAKGANGSGLTLQYRSIARAENNAGQAFTVNDREALTEFPSDIEVVPKSVRVGNYGLRGPTDGTSLKHLAATDRREACSQFTYLPDTPENRQGLDALIAAIEGVGQRLQSFLSPDAIAHTLQRAMAASPDTLLAGPDNEDTWKRASKGP